MPDDELPYVPTLPANAVPILTSNAAQHQDQAMVERVVSRRSGRPSARTPSPACEAKTFCNQRGNLMRLDEYIALPVLSYHFRVSTINFEAYISS